MDLEQTRDGNDVSLAAVPRCELRLCALAGVAVRTGYEGTLNSSSVKMQPAVLNTIVQDRGI